MLALQSFGLQPEITNTCAYADLMLAWGLARLRHTEEANRLLQQARSIPGVEDEVHLLLTEAFALRIRSVVASSTQQELLPQTWLDRREALPSLDRYRIDKLRQHCGILDAPESAQAYWASTFRHYPDWDDLQRNLQSWPSLDAVALNQHVAALLNLPTVEPQRQALVLAHALVYLPKLDAGLVERVVQQLSPVLDRVAGNWSVQIPLLVQAFRAAAELGKPLLVPTLLSHVTRLFQEVPTPQLLPQVDHLIGQVLRCLHHLNLRKDLHHTLRQFMTAFLSDKDLAGLRKKNAPGWPALLRTSCHLAAGWYATGAGGQAHLLWEEVCQDLYGSSLSGRERYGLALTYIDTLGQISLRLALARFEELWQRLQGIACHGSTNSHFTLQPLLVIDAVIRAIVQQNYVLAPNVRTWLIDDEQRVRQRIQHDFEKNVTGTAGLIGKPLASQGLKGKISHCAGIS